MKILNLTQHTLTPEQLAELGEVDIIDGKAVIDFYPELMNTPGDWGKLEILARNLIEFLSWNWYGKVILPVGSPSFQFALGIEFAKRKDEKFPNFIWAHSVRDSVETQNPDGSITKRAVFRHAGFYGTIKQ